MEKHITKINYLLILFISITLLFTGCSIFSDSDSKTKTTNKEEFMGFSKYDLKKPAQPINQAPVILFIGNSFTYFNDLPSTFGELAYSGGFQPEIDEISDGGYRLELFADKTDKMGSSVYDYLENNELDYVILQEHSRLPTVVPKELMYPAARTLDTLIKNAHAETIFFMTWAYKDGDEYDLLGEIVKKTREEMQTQLSNSYIEIANELDALLAPAGIAFMKSISTYPDIELWNEDLQHPSPAGTYLTACVLYASIFNQSPVELSYTARLDTQTALKLQQIAADTVID